MKNKIIILGNYIQYCMKQVRNVTLNLFQGLFCLKMLKQVQHDNFIRFRYNIVYSCLILIIFLFNAAYANVFQHKANISSFINEIPKTDSISCKFKQEKTVKGINKPLISGGNFKYIKNKGVYFETLYPVKSISTYTNEEYGQINSIINAISNKKYKNIESEFDFYFERENSLWHLGLKPKNNTKSSKFISTIEIEGNKNIDKITISTTKGNKITQWFFQE